jgi:glycosyltransferase involved in cell wall biosynthesis
MRETLSIILIAHNEEQAIGPMLEGLLRTYDREILEIIVVDDASTDQTAAIADDTDFVENITQVRALVGIEMGAARAYELNEANL